MEARPKLGEQRRDFRVFGTWNQNKGATKKVRLQVKKNTQSEVATRKRIKDSQYARCQAILLKKV